MASTKKVLDIEQIDQRDLQSEITSRLARLIAKSSPGSRLPTERELCELLNVGRNSLREAIKSLAFIGAVQVKRGNGIYVTSAEEAPKSKILPRPGALSKQTLSSWPPKGIRGRTEKNSKRTCESSPPIGPVP
jgi:DNA-binding FadR family transcriptional regulator